MVNSAFVVYALIVIFILILILPVISKKIERNLELFFLMMGLTSSIVSGTLGYQILYEAILAPLMIHSIPLGIFQVVLIAGIFFTRYMGEIEKAMGKLELKLGVYVIFPLLVFILGIGSSIISAVVASVIIAEVSRVLRIEVKKRNSALVVSAFSIGLGASLTPVGEPLSTILVLKLSGPPYYADFLFPFRILWVYVIPIIVIVSLISYFILRNARKSVEYVIPEKPDYRKPVMRALRIYIFVFSLTLLGSSFTPVVERFIIGISPGMMYLFGITSSFLDNATLTAAIISPSMNILQIKSFLISLLISGGFLVPGNVPNIVIAYSHGISFREWARIALPIGLPLFVAMFFIINI